MTSLAVGLASGWLAYMVGMPLPWMLGAMLGNTVAALAGAPVRASMPLRNIFVPIIGVMLGSGVSAETFEALGDWSISFLPGRLNEMLLLGGEAGGEERRIALAHASRVLLTVTFVGLFFGLVLGVQSGRNGGIWTPIGAPGVLDYLILIGCAALGVPFGRLLRLPAQRLLGPMILSAAAHVVQLVDLPPPTVFVIAAQVVMGSLIGTRFLGARLREVGRDLFRSVFSTTIMLITGVGFAWVVASLTATDLAQAFLAYSPGGLTEMSLLAFALGGDIAYVSVTHIVRIAIVVFSAPLFFRWINRR